MDFEEARNIYIEKMKEEKKPFCILCFDKNEKILESIGNSWYCSDCLYMRKLLSEIKKI